MIHCSVHCVIGLRRNSGTALSNVLVLCSLHCLRCGCVAPLQRLLGDTQGRVLAPRTITHTLMDHVSWYSVLWPLTETERNIHTSHGTEAQPSLLSTHSPFTHSHQSGGMLVSLGNPSSSSTLHQVYTRASCSCNPQSFTATQVFGLIWHQAPTGMHN